MINKTRSRLSATRTWRSCVSVAPGLLCAGLAGAACAQVTENVILNFDGTNGAYPYAPLLADNTGPSGSLRGLYGTAGNGWPEAGVFKLTPPKAGKNQWKDTTLWEEEDPFGGTGGASLYADTKRISGKTTLYGATTYGGNVNAQCNAGTYGYQGCGTIYSVTGHTMNVLWTFTGGGDGGAPLDGVIGDKAGALYAATSYGGGASNCGTVVQLTPPAMGQTAWTETTLWTFSNGDDGCYPYGLIMDGHGVIYGVTGSYSTNGTVFKLMAPANGGSAWTQQTLWTFKGSDGNEPSALTPAKAGGLYVVSGIGGSANDGTVVELSPPGKGQKTWTEQIIWNFTGGADGANPYFPVIVDKAGALYSTTFTGPSGSTAFKLTPPLEGQTAWTESTLWTFSDCTSGCDLYAGLVADKTGVLYGTTQFGGSNNFGVVFSLSGTGYVP